MQPYLLPYLGYFSLIKYTDMFISFDSVQQIYHGWLSRNRILKPSGSWQYINIPLVKHSRNTLIKDLYIKNTLPWKKKIIAQLEHYKKKAPYYKDIINLLTHSFTQDFERLADFNLYMLKRICDYLEIKFQASVFSEMGIEITRINAPDEWALEIAKRLNAEEYINLPGGDNFFSRQKFAEQGIKLGFIKNELSAYRQINDIFEPAMSIIDVLMFNSIEETNSLINDYIIDW